MTDKEQNQIRLTIKNSDGTYSQPTHTTFEKIFYRLAEFEDLIEEFDADNIECFKKKLYKIQNAKAVEALEKVKEYVNKPFDSYGGFKTSGEIMNFIDQRIKEYGGKNNAN